jgi:alpha-glucosidase
MNPTAAEKEAIMRIHRILATVIGLAALAMPKGPSPAAETVISSPDGNVQLRILLSESKLRLAVTFRNRAVIEPSPIVFTLDGVNLTEGVEAGRVDRYEVNETYPWRGVHSRAVNRCQGAKISLRHLESGTRYTLEARAQDDGAAFRFVVPGDDRPRVPDEATTFVLPAGSIVWYHDLGGHYEGVHQRRPIDEVKAGQWAAPPVTLKLPNGAGYASITEAALVHYSGMALKADGKRGLTLVLAHKHPISYPFELRYKNDIERVSKPAAISGNVTSPWRVVMIGADLNALVNCDMVHNLCPAADPTLFPQGINTEWIKPGRAVWRYLDGGGRTLEDMKEFSRLAGQLGFEYHVIEGFWSRWSDAQLKELVDYSRQQGVGLWFWKHSNQLRTPAARQAFFKRLHDLGVVGAKIDFFDHEHQEVVDFYTALLKDAAK